MKMHLVISYQEGQIDVTAHRDETSAADQIVQDTGDLEGYPLVLDEHEATLEAATGKYGLELMGNKPGYNDVTLFMRTVEIQPPADLLEWLKEQETRKRELSRLSPAGHKPENELYFLGMAAAFLTVTNFLTGKPLDGREE